MRLPRINLLQIRKTAVVLSLILLSGGVGYRLGERGVSIRIVGGIQKPKVEIINREVPPTHRTVDFSLFWRVWEELEKSYISPSALDPEAMVYGAISGMTASLRDPYTVFLQPSENQQTKENLAGSFFGVGIQLGYKDRQIAVIAPLKDMPAERAGVQAGDYILRIKDLKKKVDAETQGLSLPEAVSLIRGERGSEVALTLFREGGSDPFEITLVREEIVIPSVEITFVPVGGEGGKVVAHLKVIQFGERTGAEWDEAVAEILSKEDDLAGIILDLRNNPGGYLSGSVDLAEEFIASGTVVVQQGRNTSETLSVERQGRLIGKPLVVLVNEGSASASEILAGALRDRLKVKLVGEKTFGKGTVQEARELPGGAGLHVTTSKWVLPSGQEINDKGIIPDVEISLQEDEGNRDEQLDKALEIMTND